MGSVPAPVQWIKGSSVAIAAAWIQSLAQELLHATGTAIKRKGKKNKKQKTLTKILFLLKRKIHVYVFVYAHTHI